MPIGDSRRYIFRVNVVDETCRNFADNRCPQDGHNFVRNKFYQTLTGSVPKNDLMSGTTEYRISAGPGIRSVMIEQFVLLIHSSCGLISGYKVSCN